MTFVDAQGSGVLRPISILLARRPSSEPSATRRTARKVCSSWSCSSTSACCSSHTLPEPHGQPRLPAGRPKPRRMPSPPFPPRGRELLEFLIFNFVLAAVLLAALVALSLEAPLDTLLNMPRFGLGGVRPLARSTGAELARARSVEGIFPLSLFLLLPFPLPL